MIKRRMTKTKEPDGFVPSARYMVIRRNAVLYCIIIDSKYVFCDSLFMDEFFDAAVFK